VNELTVKVNGSLDDVITEDVAVGEVFSNDSGLRSAIPGSTRWGTHSRLVLLRKRLSDTSTDGCGTGDTGW
jgi:hypothetical protein